MIVPRAAEVVKNMASESGRAIDGGASEDAVGKAGSGRRRRSELSVSTTVLSATRLLL